jgi:hypothetical protein
MTSTGSTVVSGLNIGGVGYVVDDKGARMVGAPVPGSGPLPTGVFDPAKLLGINPHTLRARMRKLKINWASFRAAPDR